MMYATREGAKFWLGMDLPKHVISISRAHPSVRRLKGKYWHKLTNKEIQELIDAKITYGELAETVKQPTWCQYPNALEGEMGCWSLVGSARKKISHKFCKDCDCYKSA